MKTIFYSLFALMLIATLACKKDKVEPKKAFDDITYADIKNKEAQLSNKIVAVTTTNGDDILKSGSVIFYKTNQGTMGKFKITSISAQNILTIDAINYDGGGMEVLNKTDIAIFATHGCDLDLGEQAVGVLTAEFWWHIGSDSDKSFDPYNNATFYVYSK